MTQDPVYGQKNATEHCTDNFNANLLELVFLHLVCSK